MSEKKKNVVVSGEDGKPCAVIHPDAWDAWKTDALTCPRCKRRDVDFHETHGGWVARCPHCGWCDS